LPLNERDAVGVSILTRIFGKREDDRTVARPLWHAIVALSREPFWYARCGIADTVAGRFDAITLVLSVVLLRMEREPALIEPSVRLTELFVEDMDGQLRESGVGDIVVGKHIGRLMSALGGRLGVLRKALSQGGTTLAEAVARNTTMVEGAQAAPLAEALRDLAARLDGKSAAELLAGEIAA
jgi:cytochrome b pre-mRNA-processing protein 3